VILHDLECPVCKMEAISVPIIGGNFPTHCGVKMNWIPRGFHTDVLGNEKVSHVLCEPNDPTAPLRFTSSREREAKMKQQGYIPAGDRYHGSLGNSDPMRGTIYSSGKLGESKGKPNV
jgi:hypothetical protein